MDCPVCTKEPMIVMELNEIEIDYCLACKGIWLDAGELELLLGEDSLSKRFLDSFKVEINSKEKKIKCPICDKKMEKVKVNSIDDDSGSKPIVVDRCVNNHGLWFDKGELEEVITKGTWGKDDKVLAMLKGMFGKK
jgi:Zn-finger nucleic acid-binding protein